jgi:outer membrane receptor protein involved in Fe transport
MSQMSSVTGHAQAIAIKGGVLIGLLAAAGAVRAQDAELAPPDSTDIVVTAQRMEERLIDVPISVSAFTMQQLADQKIETGAELLRAIPNVNFSKDNFTSYNFAIRGIGTKATSVSADPAVAISFNSTTLLRNRLFEQEYFDIERLEVLRGPQGTLYGRNATAGVVNMIPAKPRLGRLDAQVQGEVGNFGSTRLRGMINVPLGDKFAIRGAGSWTKREGFDYNTVTDRRVNGRDLWSTRLSALWEPSDNFRINAIWEHFNEDDNRSRTGKQLCTRGETPTEFVYPSDYVVPDGQPLGSFPLSDVWATSTITRGCQNKSLFTDQSNGVPNGVGNPLVTGLMTASPFEFGPFVGGRYVKPGIDPFVSVGGKQSPNLREIATVYDPVFRAKNDIFQLNLEYDIGESLHFFSQSLYMKDQYFGSQDFFRFDAVPSFARKEDFESHPQFSPTDRWKMWLPYLGASTARGGVFCDPQVGCQDRPVAIDVAESKSKQWSQEFRLQSSFDGPVNFSVGANYVDFKTREEYTVYSNVITLIALGLNGFSDNCYDPTKPPELRGKGCVYIDPNPIGQGPKDGHNYLRTISDAKIRSMAAFGELYWKLTDTLKVTAGLRYTDDKKTQAIIPSQLLTSTSIQGGGNVDRGYPQYGERVQKWGRFTGRFAIDWKPDVSFSDSTLVYGSFSRGYKAGGSNPRGNDFDVGTTSYTRLPDDFAPEDVNAFEIGTKNSFAGGKLMFSVAAFLNDYKNYQIAQFINRGFYTENFDAVTKGLEFEAAWIPSKHFRVGATVGLLDTKIGKNQFSIDVMDRLQGHDDWVVVNPWAQSPNTCVVPKKVYASLLNDQNLLQLPTAPPPGWKPGDDLVFNSSNGLFLKLLCETSDLFGYGSKPFAPTADGPSFVSEVIGVVYDPTAPYDPSKPANYNLDGYSNYGAPNQGRGFAANVAGNKLPNAPSWTFNIGAQYTFFFDDWQLAVRGDYYRQGSSYARIYNTAYDKLKGWGNGNIALTLSRPKSDLEFQFYVKNILNDTPITDAYTGPDELGNFTNVFTLDPRIYGFNVKVGF